MGSARPITLQAAPELHGMVDAACGACYICGRRVQPLVFVGDRLVCSTACKRKAEAAS
jgi:hypothetical protein